MSLSARVPSTAQTNLFVPEIYINQAIEAAKDKFVCLDAVNTEWVSGYSKGYVFYIPKTNHVTATEVAVGSKASALNNMNTTGVTVTMNQWYEAPIDIDDMTKFQSQATLEAYAIDESTYAIQANVDSYIASLFSTLNSSSRLGSDGSAITDDVLLEAVETLNENNVPNDGKRTLILDPSGIADMMKYDKFIAAQYVNIGAVKNGNLGTSPIYGCTVKMTNNLTAATTGAYGVMIHRNAIAAKVQFHNAWTEKYPDLHLTRYQVETLYGASEAQDSFGVPIFTRKA